MSASDAPLSEAKIFSGSEIPAEPPLTAVHTQPKDVERPVKSLEASSEDTPIHKQAHKFTPRSTAGLVGLFNQGATCYLNSLVQVRVCVCVCVCVCIC
jgi:ubiquitin C-terminal hydrolase